MGGTLTKTDLGHGRGWASPTAAASIRRIDTQLGRPADINEAGRSPEKADENHRKWLAYLAGGPWAPYALPASKSVHCTGDAADSDDWYDPAAAAVWYDNGWRQTARYPNDRKKDEPWHGEHFPELDNHRNDPDPITLLGDPMSLRIIDSPFYRAAGYRVIHNGSAAMSVVAGHVQDMILRGHVDYAPYDDDNLLETEVRMVWQLGGLSTSEAAKKTADMLTNIKP